MNTHQYLILALDHRQSLKKLLAPHKPGSITAAELIRWKTIALQYLLPYVTHVLIDPEFGLPALQKIERKNTKVILSIEESGYQKIDGERLTRLKYTVEDHKKLGADMIKLLIYFNPRAKTAKHQKDLVQKISKDCQKHNLPFLLEVAPYSLEPSSGDAPRRGATPYSVLEIAKEIMSLGCKIDIYKTAYPGDKNCNRLTKTLKIPWVLLSGGEEFPIYRKNLQTAMRGGAAGFAAGRTLWKDFIRRPREKWPEFFKKVAKTRLEEIVGIVKKNAQDTTSLTTA